MKRWREADLYRRLVVVKDPRRFHSAGQQGQGYRLLRLQVGKCHLFDGVAFVALRSLWAGCCLWTHGWGFGQLQRRSRLRVEAWGVSMFSRSLGAALG